MAGIAGAVAAATVAVRGSKRAGTSSGGCWNSALCRCPNCGNEHVVLEEQKEAEPQKGNRPIFTTFQIPEDLDWDALLGNLKYPLKREYPERRHLSYWSFIHTRQHPIAGKVHEVVISGYPHGCPSEGYYKYKDIPHFKIWFFVRTTYKDDQLISCEVPKYAAAVYEEICTVLANTPGFKVIEHEHDPYLKFTCTVPSFSKEEEAK